jgi:hypothetical protein
VPLQCSLALQHLTPRARIGLGPPVLFRWCINGCRTVVGLPSSSALSCQLTAFLDGRSATFLDVVRQISQVHTTLRELSHAWVDLFSRLAGRRAHLGLSRLARYASTQGINPGGINGEVINDLIAVVRQGSLNKNPNALHRQVALIWNEAATDPELRLRPAIWAVKAFEPSLRERPIIVPICHRAVGRVSRFHQEFGTT